MQYLLDNHFSEWVQSRRKIFNELSDAQTLICCCGRLATGLHENHCGRFRAKVDSATVKELKPLWQGWAKAQDDAEVDARETKRHGSRA